MSRDVLTRIVIWAVPVLFSIVVHEVSHGWVAYKLGDDTAKRLGRLTLNPVSHIDIMGTVILPLMMILLGGPVFGWAKPVPFNPYNFNPKHNVKNGIMFVALAGPCSNIILAFIASFIFVGAQTFFSGSGSFGYFVINQFAQALIFINLILAFINIVPIPPLDGSKVLMRFLPPRYEAQLYKLERYGFIIVLILFATGALSKIILVPVQFLLNIFLTIPTILFSFIAN